MTLTFCWGTFLLVFMTGMFIGCIWRCPACNRLKSLNGFVDVFDTYGFTQEPMTVCKECLLADQLSGRKDYTLKVIL